MTRTLRKTLVVLLSVCAALVMCFGVFSLTACGKKNPAAQLYTLTFVTNGGNEIEPITAKADEKITPPEDPERDDYTFAGWYENEDLSGEKVTIPTVMPARNVTYYAGWTYAPSLAIQVKVFKLDFASYEDYVEDVALAKTVKKAIGSVVTGEEFVPEHFTLNEELTKPVEVPESGDVVLEVYVDPIYSAHYDVFESTDIIFALESEPNVLYLDRIELGRKVSTEYDPATGLFKFETEGDFVLEGKVSGEYFYYYRDTVAKKFADYAGTNATLEIKSANEVVYTDANGVAVNGHYEVNVKTGRYAFIADNTDFEFVLVTYYGVLLFRMSDGLEGYYAYDGELAQGGWALLHFDGFGTLTYIEDTGVSSTTVYDALGNGIVDMYDLGIAKLVEKTTPSVGGYDVKGVFSFADDLRGEFSRTVGYRTEYLTLDGFGGSHFVSYFDTGEVYQEVIGTYELVQDDSWYVRAYNSLIGYYVTYYSSVNSYLKVTASDGTVNNYMLYYTANEFGNTVPGKFENYSESNFGVAPGRHDITGEHIIFEGTTYVLDEDHDAFLYFKNYNYNGGSYQTVQIWYGTKDADGDFVYELFITAAWYAYGNEVYDPDGDYDGMYFEAMANDGSFAFKREDYEGDVVEYVFFEDENGKIYVDALGVAHYAPAEGDEIEVSYSTSGMGLLYIVEFSGLPEGVPHLFAVYTDVWAWYSTGEIHYYDISAEGSVLDIAYADGEEGGDIQLVITDEYTFVGVVASDTDGNSFMEYIFAGEKAPVEGSDNEFTFVWNYDIYYDMIDYYDDIDFIIELFADFQFKVEGNSFYLFDGFVVELTNGEDAFETDGYGFATLTVDGKTMNGYYYVWYSIVEFTNFEDEDEFYLLKPNDLKNPTTFKVIDLDSDEVDLYIGEYYETYLYDGEPIGLLGSTLFLDGLGNFYYADVIYSDDYFSYEIVEYYGEYEFVKVNNSYTQGLVGAVAAAFEFKLTFAQDDERIVLILLYDVYGNGDFYGFFVNQNKAIMGDYNAYTDDGEELGELLGGDGFNDEGAIFFGEDADGEFAYSGYMARGFIDDKYYNVNPQFTEDEEGNVVVFVTYDEEGYMLQFVFDIDEQDPTKVVYRSMFYGTVAEYDAATRYSGNYMYLDGHGKATLYSESGSVIAEGEYKPADEIGDDVYLFVGGGQNFAFKPTYSASDAAVNYYYTKYTADENGIYVNDEWAVLWLDGFGSATYINKYGVAYYGEYYKMVEDSDSTVYCLRVTYSSTRLYFELTKNGDFHELEGEFLIRAGVLYAYFGSDTEVTIPDEVVEIAAGAFALSGANNITKINFNNVERIADEAFFYATNLEEIVSDKITYIGKHAFDHVFSLKKVDLGGIVTLDEYAFYGCIHLNEIKLGSTVQEIKAYAFSRSIASLSDDFEPVILDLTAVEDPTAIDLSIFAFQAEQGWMGLTDKLIFTEGSKILVSGDVDMLNKILASENFKKTVHITVTRPTTTEEVDWTVDLAQFVELALTEDPVAGKTYYNFVNEAFLTFKDGTLIKYTKSGSYDFDETTLGNYYVQDGTVYVYSFNGSSYVAGVSFALGGDHFTVDGLEVYEAGKAATVTYSVAGDKQLAITYTASVSFFSWGPSVDVRVNGVSYDGHEASASSISYSQSYGTITFNANSHSYTATLSGGEWTVVDNGVEIELYDKTSNAVWFKAIFTVSDSGEVALKYLGYNAYIATYPDSYSTVYDYSKVDDEYKWNFSANNALYILEYVAENDGEPAKIVVTNNGYSMKDDGYDYTISLKIDESNDTIIEITGFADYYGNPYTINEIKYSEDRKSATLETEDGTFVLRLDTYYGSYVIYVTHVNYDYEPTLNSTDYKYRVTVKIHVDEEGNKTITEFVKIEDTSDYPYVALDVATQSVDPDGTVHITLSDGRSATITLVLGSWSDTVSVVWND